MAPEFFQMRFDFTFCSTKRCASETVKLATDFDIRQDPFTVCLLATDKDDDSKYKLMNINFVTGEESILTEIPYRNNCAMIYVVCGMQFYKCLLKIRQ